jgi:hypothetical protein
MSAVEGALVWETMREREGSVQGVDGVWMGWRVVEGGCGGKKSRGGSVDGVWRECGWRECEWSVEGVWRGSI